MTCRPTTLATKYASTYLTQSSSEFTANLGFADLLKREANPIDRFDRDALVEASKGFNGTIRRVDLTNYPYVESRVAQGDILYPEFGDFLIQAGYSLDVVTAVVNDFPVVTYDVTTNSVDILPVANIPVGYAEIISHLELHYSENIANTISGGFCGAFSNPFSQILKAVATIQLGVNLLDKLANFSLEDLFDQLGTLKTKLIAIVDGLKETLVQQVQAIADNATQLLSGIGRQTNRLLKSVHSRIQNVRSFLDDLTIESIKSEIEKFVNQSVDQFEELTPEAIALLMFRFCQFAELIQSFMKSPIDVLSVYVSGIVEEHIRLEAFGNDRSRSATQAGAVRLSEAGIQDGQSRMAAASARRVTGPYVSDPHLTQEENASITNISAAGVPGRFIFSSGVISMHTGNGSGSAPGDTYPGAGYAEVDHMVWQKLMIVSREFGRQLTINSAYRSPQYNRANNGAFNSLHCKGKAIDISTNGLSDSEIRRLIGLLSQVGFQGMGSYKSFIHVDTGSRRVWGPNGSRSSLNQTRFKSALERHESNGYRTVTVTVTSPESTVTVDVVGPQ